MIRTSESVAALSAALVEAQADMPSIPKNATGQVGSAVRAYADLSSVLESIQPVLAKHGLAFVQFPHGGNAGFVTVVTRIIHKSGEWMECDASMPAGNGAQAVGSATTYAKRYSLMAVFGLATEDDDGAAASQPQRQQRAPRRQEPRGDPEPATGGITEAQIRGLAASFNGIGITARDDRIQFIIDVVGHPIESSKDLTKAEASMVFDALKERAA